MSTFEGYFQPYFGRKIRADRFTDQDASTCIQLLSHAHADHTVGLSSRQLRGLVYCTAATRDILLRSATASERVHADIHDGVKSEDYYTFQNLREPVLDARGKPATKNGKKIKVEVLKCLSLDERHDFSDIYGSPLAITLIDANHCPGAVMFLIESTQHAVLYTGDIRAEPFLINRLRHNPVLEPYMASSRSRRTLDEIYLDTAAVMTRSKILSKSEGVEEVIKLIDMFPSETRFFFNCWTWGYEELLRSVAQRYKCKIHVDEYKQRIFSKETVSDHDADNSSVPKECPVLADIGTSSCQTTRFHACERRWKCPLTRGDGQGCFEGAEGQLQWEKQHARALRAEAALAATGQLPHLVFANPAEATPTGWAAYAKKVKAQCGLARHGLAKWPTNILMPLARHSTLPELQDLVGLFKPKCIYPNTIYPEAKGADYLSLPSMFGHLLAAGGTDELARAARAHVANLSNRAVYMPRVDVEEGTEEEVEAREARLGKFASSGGIAGRQLAIENFDHLDDYGDVELLMLDDEVQQKTIFPEAPPPVLNYLRPPAKTAVAIGREASVVSTSSLMAFPDLQPPNIPIRTAVHFAPSLDRPNSPAASSIPSKASSPLAAAHPRPRLAASLDKSPMPDSVNPLARRSPSRSAKAFLAGNAFCFESDAEEVAMEELHSGILAAGGAVLRYGTSAASQRTAVASAQFVVCEKRSGTIYEVARELNKPIGNRSWLLRVLEWEVLADPSENLLWHPLPTRGLPALENMGISSTGFSQTEKDELERIVELLGASYQPQLLKAETKILIAANSDSRKCAYGKKWKIPTVNFLWLEDCFLRQELVLPDESKYAPASAPDRRIGERTIRLSADSARASNDQEPVAVEACPPASAKRDASLSLSPSRYRQPASKKVRIARHDGPQSFESVTASHRDDSQQIASVSKTVRKGHGLPRLRSVEEL